MTFQQTTNDPHDVSRSENGRKIRFKMDFKKGPKLPEMPRNIGSNEDPPEMDDA
jgi:hypothetical protein